MMIIFVECLSEFNLESPPFLEKKRKKTWGFESLIFEEKVDFELDDTQV